MDTVFIKTKQFVRLPLTLFLAFLFLSFFAGCDPLVEQYPCSSDSKWVCNDPAFVLEYAYTNERDLKTIEYLEYAGEVYYVSVSYRGHQFWILPLNSNHYDDRLFTGTWKYVRGDLVFQIEEDYLFDGLFSKFVFQLVE